MKKNNYLKIAILFLYAISILIVFCRTIYLKNKEKEMTENVIEYLENIEVQTENEDAEKEENAQEENIIFQNGEIGMVIIPSIEVKAPIYEGTSNDVLKYTVRTFYRN